MCVQIADFGMSRALLDTDYYISRGGKIPVKWTAPEALDYKKYSTASDVWSFAVVLYEIWSLGAFPYHHMTNNEVCALAWHKTMQVLVMECLEGVCNGWESTAYSLQHSKSNCGSIGVKHDCWMAK